MLNNFQYFLTTTRLDIVDMWHNVDSCMGLNGVNALVGSVVWPIDDVVVLSTVDKFGGM